MLTTVVENQSKNAMHLSVQTSVSILVSLRSARSAAKEAHITSQNATQCAIPLPCLAPCMKLNGDKCHLMIFGEKTNDLSIKIGDTTIIESTEEKLLGVTLDKKLSFKTHVQSLCKKASQKLYALSRISYLLETEKLKHIMRAFILSQFSYCPLVWMFCDRHLDSKINHIHKKALSIAYKDSVSAFDTLLIRDNSVSVHKRNLQLLMTEIYKTKSNITPSFMKFSLRRIPLII